MSIQKLKWETEDGRYFDTFEEAERHELVTKVARNLGETFGYRNIDCRQIVEHLLDSFVVTFK